MICNTIVIVKGVAVGLLPDDLIDRMSNILSTIPTLSSEDWRYVEVGATSSPDLFLQSDGEDIGIIFGDKLGVLTKKDLGIPLCEGEGYRLYLPESTPEGYRDILSPPAGLSELAYMMSITLAINQFLN